MVAHTRTPITQEVQKEKSQVLSQPKIQSEALYQKQIKPPWDNFLIFQLPFNKLFLIEVCL